VRKGQTGILAGLVLAAAAVAARADHSIVYTVDDGDIGVGGEANSGPSQREWQVILGSALGFIPSGKPVLPFDANLHQDARFTFTVQAPPGKQFLVNPRPGHPAYFLARLTFAVPPYDPTEVWTRTLPSAYHFEIDGSESGALPEAEVAIDGSSVRWTATLDHNITGPVTFQSLTFTVDYARDFNGQPLAFPDVTGTYLPGAAWIGFQSSESILDPGYTPEVERFVSVVPVPEPVSTCALVVGGTIALTRPRARRPRS
jgi:hypothetical protein